MVKSKAKVQNHNQILGVSYIDENPKDVSSEELKILSRAKRREAILLANRIRDNGVYVLGVRLEWPRDGLFFYNDGSFTWVDTESKKQVEMCPHMAYIGGLYLKGNDFFVFCHFEKSSAEGSKLKDTFKIFYENFGISKVVMLKVGHFAGALANVSVSGNDKFYGSDICHVDTILNIGNLKKKVFTYDHTKLLEAADYVSGQTGYDVVPLPLGDAAFASVGFVELGDYMVVDCRAEGTADVLKSVGYKVIQSPIPMEATNKMFGSIHCLTTEMPDIYKKSKFHPFKGRGNNYEAYRSMFTNLEGYRVIMPPIWSGHRTNPIEVN